MACGLLIKARKWLSGAHEPHVSGHTWQRSVKTVGKSRRSLYPDGLRKPARTTARYVQASHTSKRVPFGDRRQGGASRAGRQAGRLAGRQTGQTEEQTGGTGSRRQGHCMHRPGNLWELQRRRIQDCRGAEAAGPLELHDMVAVPILDVEREDEIQVNLQVDCCVRKSFVGT